MAVAVTSLATQRFISDTRKCPNFFWVNKLGRVKMENLAQWVFFLSVTYNFAYTLSYVEPYFTI